MIAFLLPVSDEETGSKKAIRDGRLTACCSNNETAMSCEA